MDSMDGMDRIIDNKGRILRKRIIIAGGTVILVVIIFYAFLGARGSKLNVSLDKITVEPVTYDLFQDYIAVVGTVEPIQTVYLDATEGGRIEEIYRREGAMVKKGDDIMRLSNDNLLLEISNYETEVARAINDLKTMRVNLENQQISNRTQLVDLYYDLLKLERDYKKNIALEKDKYISREEFLISKENYERKKRLFDLLSKKNYQDSISMNTRIEASEESVGSMQKNLGIIRTRLVKLTIKAPVDGELATLNPEIGQVISYGTRIGTINILDSYKVKADIDEHYISRIKPRLTAYCEFSEKDYQATITKVYPEVKDGRFSVDMVFTGQIPLEIRIGQTSRIRLELGESKQALLVSRGGFYQTTGGQWIFVVDKTGKKAIKRNIRIGRQNPKYYEVLEGLEKGEQVIVSGYENFGTADQLILKEN
ncbi:MAG TPA: efflux RND transporter periplasmic adaptor subunit [Bacteroidales bacterium]